MKAISDTRIARAINPMSGDGSSELFSITLEAMEKERNAKGDLVWASREEKELARGLVVSPEKVKRTKGKGGGMKYIR